MTTYPEHDPRHHTAKIQTLLGELVTHLREDIATVQEPKAQALFETSAEVLQGLEQAFTDYEQRTERGWRR